MNSLWATIILILLSSCSIIASYPICQFNGPVGQEGFDVLKTNLSGVSKLTSDLGGKKLFITADRRFVILKGSRRSHNSLEDIWPEIGCIGKYRSLSEERKLSSCIKYQEMILEREGHWQTEDELLQFCSVADNCTDEQSRKADALIFCNGTKL